jgi:hypothetical protein
MRARERERERGFRRGLGRLGRWHLSAEVTFEQRPEGWGTTWLEQGKVRI